MADSKDSNEDGTKDATETSSVAQQPNPTALPPEPEAIAMDWYILKVAFNREDQVKDALLRKIKIEGMEEFFEEILVPTEDVVEFTKSGKRKVVKRKLFPGYLMARMHLNDETWFLARETTGVSDFTGRSGRPSAMEPEEVERVLKVSRPVAGEDQPMKTAIPFNAGDRVRVKEGYFQNLEGDVDKVDEANGRVTVIISIFGRSTPVELDHWQVEPL